MGRKSNAKKAVRKLIEEKEATEKKNFLGKKSKKELKKEVLKSAKNKKIKKKSAAEKILKKLGKIKELRLKVNKQTLFSGVLAIIMLLLLISVGFILFQKAFQPTPLAKYLPEDHTIAVLEININKEHNQFLKTFDLLSDYPKYSRHELIKYFETKFLINYENEISPWIGRQAGIAYLHSQKEKGKIMKIYFAEIFSKTNAKNFVKDNKITSYEGKNVYKLKQTIYVTFIGEYLVFSGDEQGIYEIIDFQKEKNKLYDASAYRKIDNNLPLSKAAFLYVNFDEMTDSFFKELPLLSEKGISVESARPFLKLFDSEGFALIATDNNFALESFLTLDTEELEGGKYVTFKEKYEAKLTGYILEDTLAFWGGKNLELHIKRIIEVLSGGDKAAMLVFDNLLQNYTQKYFGSSINFEKDILSILKGEFSLAIEKIDGKHIYKIVLELENPKLDALALREIANSFAMTGGVFEPKIVEYTLEDGTISREIVAIPEEIEKEETIYEDTIIYGLKMGEREWGIYYAFIEKIAIIANNIEGVKSTIDIMNGKHNSLRSTNIYQYNIKPVLRSSDEVSYFNVDKLLPVLFGNKVIPEFLKPIESLSSGKNYFNDGIKAINYIRIKENEEKTD